MFKRGIDIGGTVKTYPTLRVVEETGLNSVTLLDQWNINMDIIDGVKIDSAFLIYGIDRHDFENQVQQSENENIRSISIPKLGLLLRFVHDALDATN